MQQTIPHVADAHTRRLSLPETDIKLLAQHTVPERSDTAITSNFAATSVDTEAVRPLSSSSEVRNDDKSPALELNSHAGSLHESGSGNSQQQDVAATSAVTAETGLASAAAQDGTALSTGEAMETPAEAVPPAAAPSPDTPPVVATEPSVSALCASTAPESSLIAPVQGAAPHSISESAAGVKAGVRTDCEHPRATRFMSPELSTPTKKGSNCRSRSGATGASARVSGCRESLRHLSALRRWKPGSGIRHRRRHFSGGGGASCKNFYRDEDIATFGIGTVGLFASTAKPVTDPHAGKRKLLSSAHHRRAHGECGHRTVSHPTVLPSCRTGAPPTSGAADTASAQPCYYTPACYMSRSVNGIMTWEKRQEEYQNWRRENLKRSTYYRFSRPLEAPRDAQTSADNDDDSVSSLYNDDVLALCSSEERYRMECLRLRALEAERKARSNAREQAQAMHEKKVLHQRTRKLRGEAVELPDSYLRFTYPDPSTITGYAELAVEGDEDSTYLGPHTSKVGGGYLANPERVVKDHHRAMQQRRLSRQQERLNREAQRLEAAERQRHDMAAQLAENQLQEAAYVASWMEGRPRICRARERERHARQEVERCALDEWNRAAQRREREAYSLYASQEEAAATAHQLELRARVLAPRPYSRKGILGGHRLEQEVQPLPATSAAQYKGDAEGMPGQLSTGAPDFSDTVGCPPHAAAPPPSIVPSQAPEEKSKRAARPVTATVYLETLTLPPSQVVGPTSTNFFNEVKQWMREFPSPNTVPLNGSDAAYRRAWKAELEEAQLRFNREATQRQREDIVRRVQEAREKAFEGSWDQAEQKRHEKRDLAARRAGHTQSDVEAATAVRLEVRLEAHRAQQQRMVQAAERHNETQFLRQQSKQREVLLRSLEAEELQKLRTMVSSTSEANRG
ncbi:hypothetical protein, conserved [Leishmania tarentolae]|uniref:Uncharacterized protein n=1 Tax=Leishmania tarentolae TaxID=5689 RepID=A0A640KJ14_LEITA|nr:hypothetical protein, conserved [Leishmania tarentolae]